MRQRMILSALLSVLTLAIHASDVSEQQARQIAAKAMSASFSPTSGSQRARAAKVAAPSLAYLADKGGRNNLYVFNNEAGEGFVIVSGSDQTTASVLGYSDKGHFDIEQVPENLKFLLDMYEEQIIAVRSKGTEANTRAPSSDELGNVAVGPLLKTTWSQSEPYSNITEYVTGCVPTAMAQIMAYWKYPKKGRGNHVYDNLGKTLSADFSSSAYDWDNMLNGYADVEYTEAQGNAVARLMADCGISIQANYGGLFGTDAHEYDVPIALVKYFGYSLGYKYLISDDYETQEWEDMMRAELDAKRPILYSGSPRDEKYGNVGHSFVCDGYTDNGYFHFNLGWEGRGNGWYKTPSITGYDDSWDFTNGQTMIIGIQPNERQAEKDNIFYAAINDHEATVVGCNESDCYELDVPSTIDIEGKSYQVTDIWQYSFQTDGYKSANINNIKIPGTIKSISDSLFFNCQELTNVEIADGPKRIGSHAFHQCNKLESVQLPYSSYTIGDYSFYGCSALKNIHFDDASKIGVSAFGGCRALEYISTDAEEVGDAAFAGCTAVKDVSLGANVKKLGNRLFQECDVQRINVDENNPVFTAIDAVIYNKDMSVIHYCSPSNHQEYGYGVRGEFTIPETVTQVDAESFGDLTSLTIPSTLVDIGENAFRSCASLKDVYNYATTPQQIQGVFNGGVFGRPDWNKCTLHVLPGCKAAYQAAEGWKLFEVIEEDLKQGDTISDDNSAETVRNAVKLWLPDLYYWYGLETNEFLFSSEPKFTYVKNVADYVADIVFSAKDVEINFSSETVLGAYFTHLDDPTGINDVKTDNERNIRYEISARRIRISGLQDGESVSLFDLGGSVLASAKADAGGMVDFGLSGTSGMVYVVKVGDKSFKLTIK